MDNQLSFGGIDAPVSIDSLFFALLPDAESASQIINLTERLRADHLLKGPPIPSERLHVTLAFLGPFAGLPKSVVSSAISAGDKFKAASVEVAFDRVQKFGHDKRALVLRGGEDGAGMIDFRRRLVEGMGYEGLKPAGPSGFTPHLTLLYDDIVVDEAVKPIAWIARELVLVHSLVGLSRHEILGRWPLQ